jgi:LysM repeat protein
MVDPDRLRVWVARLAAPLAFFFAATVLVVLVQRGLESDPTEAVGPSAGTTETNTGPTTTPDGTTTAPPACRRRVRVRSGDTLESIAERCRTTVADILDLNPNIDPLALSPGQLVRVRRAAA